MNLFFKSVNSGGFEKGDNMMGNIKLNTIVRNNNFKISPNLPEYNILPNKHSCNYSEK